MYSLTHKHTNIKIGATTHLFVNKKSLTMFDGMPVNLILTDEKAEIQFCSLLHPEGDLVPQSQ
jgi:hypothetical protein